VIADAECLNCGRLLDERDRCWNCDADASLPVEPEDVRDVSLTEAQTRLTLNALETAIGDMSGRAEVLAAGEVCNQLRDLLGMEAVTYWDDAD